MSPRGEWLGVAFWAGLGTTLFVASWRMDRLSHQGIAPWSAPGLLPGVVGALMVAFALVLAVQAWQGSGSAERAESAGNAEGAAGADDAQEPSPSAEPTSWASSALAATLCVLFAGASLGRGWPFQVEAAAFILVFTALFRWREWRAEGRLARGVAQTAVIAIVASLAIAWLFESVFLVRLP